MLGRRSISAATLSLLVAGCAATYHQAGVEALGTSQVVVVETDTALACMAECVNLIYVDGKNRGFGSFAKYELTPGYHEIGIQYMSPNAKGIGRNVTSESIMFLGFNGDAGHSYRIKSNVDLNMMGWRPQLVDTESGAVVSKIVRSEQVSKPNS